MIASKSKVITVCEEFSSDLITPIQAFLRLRSHVNQRSFLLESVEGGERLGRYSFLGIDPIETLRVRNGKTYIEDQNEKLELNGNPFTVIGDYLSKYQITPKSQLPPFCGGVVGYIGYDFVQYLESIALPALSTQKFDEDEVCLMLFQDVIAFDHVHGKIFILSHVFLDRESKTLGLKRAKARIQALVKKLQKPAAKETFFKGSRNTKGPAPQQILAKKAFLNAVAAIKKHIRSGDIFQCVISSQFRLSYKKDPFFIYRNLRTTNPSPYLFYLSFGDSALVGASPEMLVRISDDLIETCPIAGTRRRGKTEAEDDLLEQELFSNEKEKAEHLMLVDLSRNDLGRVCAPGTVRVREFMQVHRFSHVMHLVSLVEGKKKKSLSSWDVFGSCFPAGTLTGAPKIRAMQIISEHEPHRRGPYGGAVIAHDFSGNLNSCITIRSVFVKKGIAYGQAGAGIVADSDPKAEHQEALNKFQAVANAITAANQRLK